MGRKMNIEIDLDNFTEEQENKFAELLNIGKDGHKSRVWKPKIGEIYFTVSLPVLGKPQRIVWKQWNDDNLDNYRWELGFVFKTEEEAEFALEKLKVKAELERYALEHNDPDLEGWDGDVYCKIVYDMRDNEIIIEHNCDRKNDSVTYFTSEKIAEDAIKTIGEKRIIKYLFGVDCEEDEQCTKILQ